MCVCGYAIFLFLSRLDVHFYLGNSVMARKLEIVATP